ncbi:hypothetical protein ACWD0J_31580 [Streptomyces sp. NPDC003011]
MKELERRCFSDLTGVDASPAMISRAHRLYPTMRCAARDAPPATPCTDAGFAAVLLFAVLTCIPGDEHQIQRPGQGLRPLRDPDTAEDADDDEP